MPEGYSQDVLTRVINVKWPGLAVIFGKEDTDAPLFTPAPVRLAEPANEKEDA